MTGWSEPSRDPGKLAGWSVGTIHSGRCLNRDWQGQGRREGGAGGGGEGGRDPRWVRGRVVGGLRT